MMPKFLKKLLKIFAILSVVCIAFLGFVYVKYSNFDGYCEEAGKILTEEELLKRAVREDIYKNDPYCCYRSPGGWLSSDVENFFFRFFGSYHYQINLYYKRPLPLTYDFNDPYYENHIITDQCGHRLDSYGITTSEESYKAATNFLRKY